MEYRIYRDGGAWCAVDITTFTNIQESQIGFGNSPVIALEKLLEDVTASEVLRCDTSIRSWKCGNCNKEFTRGKVKLGIKPECY